MTKKIYSMLLSLFLSINCLSAQIVQTVNVPTAGSLSTAIGSNLQTTTDLTLTGTINATDFQTIKQMIALKNLDMSKVSIIDNTIPASAFQNRVLNSLILPEGLETIGPNAFYGSTINIGLLLPSTVTLIKNHAFRNIGFKVDLSKTKNNLTTLEESVFESYKYELDFSDFTKLTNFINHPFWYATSHVVLPQAMKVLPASIFAGFRGTVTLPQDLKTIGSNAFDGSVITSLTLPEGLETIGSNAFYRSTINTGLLLPSTVTLIKNHAFRNIGFKVDLSKTRNNLTTLEESVFESYKYELDFSDFTKLTNFINHPFWYATSHVVLPQAMKVLPVSIFAGFRGTVTLPQDLKTIGSNAFDGSVITSLTLPEGLETIGSNAFYGSTINTGLLLPSTVTLIKNHAFRNIGFKVDLSKTKNNLTTLEESVFESYKYELDFSDFTKLTNFINHPFWYATSHVVLPQAMKVLPVSTFAGFRGTVTLHEGLEKLGNNAFQNSTIKKIDLPASVTSIGANAFYNVTQLDTIITRNTTPPTLGTNVFYGVNKETTQLKVPNNSINLYSVAAQWKDFINISTLSKIQADPFEKGKEGSVYISIPTNTTEGIDMQGWDYDNNKTQDGQPIVKTYKTIEIDEYTWLSENLRLKYKWNDWMNLTQADVDQYSKFYLGGQKILLSQFEDIFGTWVSLYPKALSYQSQFTVFSSKGGSTEKGWQLPSSADIWQLYGLAPRKSGNIYKDVQDFLFMSPCENDLDLRKNMMNRDNISGLTLTPLGMRESFYGDEAKIYGFGTLVGLRTNGWTRIEAISDLATSGILPGMRSLDLYHFSQARYIKPKTDKELGYKIYIDVTNDKVLMLSYDQVSTLPVLEKGLERGIALRYANRQEMQVLKKWSEIQAEATEIRNALIAVNVPQPLPACDRPIVEDGPDPYQKGKESSVHIWISENGADGDGVCFQAYDFDTNQERGINQGFQGTYKTIEVGEYNYTEENLKAIGRDRWGTYYSWFRWTDNNIASITHSFSQETPLSVNEFTKVYGSWFSRLPAVFAYANPNHVIFRDKEGGSIQQGWGLPSITDILQMIGQAPSTGNINYDILNFAGASSKDVPVNHQADWYNRYNNISGLTLTPLGSRHPIEGNLASDVYAFKVLSKLRLKDNGSRATFNFYVSGSFYEAEDDHYSQVRYTRAKSNEELGYKLYIDNCNDKVVMLPYTQKSNLIELPKGLERGIALRYANRGQMKIYKTWTEICAEADQIRNSFNNLPARENFNYPQCNGNTNPEIPEEPDPKPENPENPEIEIQIETYPADDIDRIDKISFAYDLAGNRVKKEIILVSTRSLVEEDQTFVDDISKFQVTIFPNPTKGLITIAIKDFVSTNVTNKLTVFDLNGRVVAQEKITTNTAQVDISSQSRGTYILVISIDGKSSSWKIIKE